MKRNPLSLAINGAAAVSAALLLNGKVHAQDEEPIMEEITVTGSLIKRSDLDSALPIQVIDADKMARVGIITAQDLVRKVPAMQNFTTPADSVGGGGGGLSTANLRGIGDQYTLSLLNGRRMAPATAGSTIDLNNIPLAAVEQVDILTDGASALYGSDAIAGVVNFIMKDSVDETTISFRKDIPEESGGESWVFDLVTGFGNLDEDGYSLVFSYSHEEQDALAAADRDFAETGFITFNSGGQQLYFENSSANSIPGNAYVYTAGYESLVAAFNPNRMANGSCAAQTTPSGDLCFFDYTSTLEILPEHEKDIFFLNGKMDFNENITGFATVLYGTTETINRIAPYPTGLVPLPLDSDLVAEYVLPNLTADEIAQMGEVGGTWRALPGSNRTTKYEIETSNITFGIDGSAGEINYSLAATISETTIDQDYPTGWLLLEEFGELAGSGAINIFASQDEFGPEDAEILSGAVYSGDWDDTETSQTVLEANAGMPLFEMAGGEAQLAVGFDWRRNIYERTVSEANANELLLFLSKDTPYELERDQWGVFSEMLLPVADGLEFTASLRYNDVGATSDELNGTGDIDEGDSDLSYKLSAFWTAIDQLAFRGSFGTGFKAPSMREIGEPLSDFGVTSGTYACPFGAGDARAATCNPGSNQYAVFREGSGGLTFETSEQYSFGLVFTPYDQLEVTVDYWSVEIEDQVDRLTEQEIFANPDVYSDLFTTRTNLSTGRDELAIIQAAVNVATQENTGIDWRIAHGFNLGWGQLDLGLNGTYMIESESSLYGSSLGRFGSDDQVVFRNIANFDVTLYHGNFTHTLFLNYRSGYEDQVQTVTTVVPGEELGTGDEVEVQLEVDSYTLVDYQFKWTTLEDSLDLTFGIKNLFDEEPPLSLRTSGAGHQVGWDPRYTDAFGRTMYLRAAYSF